LERTRLQTARSSSSTRGPSKVSAARRGATRRDSGSEGLSKLIRSIPCRSRQDTSKDSGYRAVSRRQDHHLAKDAQGVSTCTCRSGGGGGSLDCKAQRRREASRRRRGDGGGRDEFSLQHCHYELWMQRNGYMQTARVAGSIWSTYRVVRCAGSMITT
jgi:hypothetical protein